MMRTPSIRSQDDPLSLALRPPPTETEVDRQVRLHQEAEARRISEQIDEELRAERKRLERSKGDVKLLLLGQAESGKSTLQKQFQLMYSPASMESERMSWRTVVYFNVARSIKKILATLEVWGDVDDGMDSQSAIERQELGNDDFALLGTSEMGLQAPQPAASLTASSPSGTLAPTVWNLTKPISELRLRLLPLVSVEPQLADRLSGGVSVAGSGKGEVFVRSGWQARSMQKGQKLMGRISRRSDHQPPEAVKTDTSVSADFAPTPSPVEADPLIEDVANMLDQLQDDMRTLWEHPVVRALISNRKLKLDEWSEFAFDQVRLDPRRVYLPADESPKYLEEDPRTNRIDDSLQLFTQICANQLLKRVHLVLFLNKTDILRKKLERGLQVSKYILSYGERPNEYEPVVNYFRAHFLQVHRRNNENQRVLYTHLTNVTDTKATQRIIANVRDSIFRGYLQSAALV
ncbi:hypothetical protein ID866_7476 [Astraeus odoratus]|nr:hypothetical protein ID866_7476 [Astraeus odoratus]